MNQLIYLVVELKDKKMKRIVSVFDHANEAIDFMNLRNHVSQAQPHSTLTYQIIKEPLNRSEKRRYVKPHEAIAADYTDLVYLIISRYDQDFYTIGVESAYNNADLAIDELNRYLHTNHDQHVHYEINKQTVNPFDKH